MESVAGYSIRETAVPLNDTRERGAHRNLRSRANSFSGELNHTPRQYLPPERYERLPRTSSWVYLLLRVFPSMKAVCKN
jgi:hypothetical protein